MFLFNFLLLFITFFLTRQLQKQCPIVSSALKCSHLCSQQSFSSFDCGCLVAVLSVVHIYGARFSFVSFLVSASLWFLFILFLLRTCLVEVFCTILKSFFLFSTLGGFVCLH